MSWLPGCSDNVMDCGEQTEYMNSILEQQQYDDKWEFWLDAGTGHAWGVGFSHNPNDPILWYDTRANDFSVNNVCSHCEPWIGEPTLGEEYFRNKTASYK